MISFPHLVVTAIAAALLFAGEAAAHAVLVEATPADGAVLPRSPAAITLRFNEPVVLTALRVQGEGNREILLADRPRSEGERVAARLPPDLPAGGYVVSYRVVSGDSHPVAGSIVFHVGAAPGRPGPAASPARAADAAAALDLSLRLALLLVLLWAGGLALFAATVAPLPPRAARVLPALALLGAALAMAAIGAHGAAILGLPATGLVEPAAWRAGAAGSQAWRAAAAVIGMALVAAGPALLPGRAGRWSAAAGGLLAIAGTAVTGHVATAEPRWLAAPLLAVHAAGVGFWLGALWPLCLALRGEPPAALVTVRRFSRRAVPVVALVLASGAAIALLQLGTPWALLATDYGRMLSVKLLLVAGVLLIAERNRRVLTPGLAAGGSDAPAAMRAAIRLEALLLASAVAAAAFLGATPPPRSAAGPTGMPAGIQATARGPAGEAAILVTPGRTGPNRIDLRLSGPGGTALAAKEVSVTLANPAAGIAPFDRPATALDAGLYAVYDAPLLAAGIWTVAIGVLVSDFEKTVLRTEFAIP